MVARAEALEAEVLRLRAALLRDREADRARRKELEDLAGRAARIQAAIDEAGTRVSQLEKTVSGKAAVLDGIRRAEEAQTYSQELEAKRQEDERLKHESELARQRQQSAVAEHARKVEALKERTQHQRAAHEREIDGLLARIETLTRQAQVLDEVPCANLAMSGGGESPADDPRETEAALDHGFLGRALMEDCPLIAQAREARAALPALEERLKQLQSEQPRAEDERQWRRYSDGYHRWHLMRGHEETRPRRDIALCGLSLPGSPGPTSFHRVVEVCDDQPNDGRPLCQTCLRLARQKEVA